MVLYESRYISGLSLKPMSYRYLLTTAALLGLTFGVANAGSIAIVNPSFEADILTPTGTFNNPAAAPGISFGFASGWVKTDPAGDSVGVWSPVTGGHQSTSADPSYSQYPDLSSAVLPAGFTGSAYQFGVPDGHNFGEISYGFFHQVVIENVQVGLTYTLKAFVGTRWDYDSVKAGYDQYYGNQGYFMELGALNSYNPGTGVLDRNTLARISTNTGDVFFNQFPSVNSPDDTLPGRGEWKQISLNYTVGANDPNIGKSLVIVFGSPGRQADFDMVTLDSTSGVPEPASFAFVLGGLALIGLKLRRK